MVRRRSFVEMQAEQAKMTESWKAEGRLSEAWVVADPEIIEIFSAVGAPTLLTLPMNGAKRCVKP